LSFILSSKANDLDKISSYECGFSPFEDTKNEFNIKFYLVGILFLVFDLELSFLFPYIVSLNAVDQMVTYYMMIFLILLTVGFVYE